MAAMAETDASPGAVGTKRPLRLLIADDDPTDVELLVALLRRVGHQVSFSAVVSPEAFRQKLQEAEYDLVLADHNLVTWSGMDALEMLRQSGKDIPFVVITGTLGDEAAVEYIKAGAADYVLKHRLQRLPVAVENVLRDLAHRREEARLQREISRAKREWEQTFDNVADPVLVFDEQCQVRRANRAAAQVLGWEFSQLLGRPCGEVLRALADPPPDCFRRHIPAGTRHVRRDLSLIHI